MGKYYNVGINLTVLGTSLTDYYGAGVTIHYSISTNLIFSCPAIGDKTYRIYLSSSALFASYGTAYNGTTGVTDETQFCGSATTGTLSALHLVAYDTILVLFGNQGTQNSKLICIGRLSNNLPFVCGAVGNSSTSYTVNHFGYITTPFSMLDLVCPLTTDIQTQNGKIMRGRILANVPATGVLMDGSSLVYINEIYSSSRSLGQTTFAIDMANGYVLTQSGLYVDASMPNTFMIRNSILCPNLTAG